MIDYQWPYQSVKPTPFYRSLTSKNVAISIQKIETFFEHILNKPVLLMPSARAAMSLAFSLHRINRSHVAFAPKWSSHCVWDIIGRYTNPTIEITSEVDVILSVHKWGSIEKLSNAYPSKLIVEDSVDSLFIDSTSLFPNGGTYEILSLPKIIGAYSGGIMIFKNHENKIGALEFVKKHGKLLNSDRQAQIKYRCVMNNTKLTHEWGCMEYKNFIVSNHEVENIEKCLLNYEINKQTIESRLQKLNNYLDIEKYIHMSHKRLPPLLGIELENWSNTNGIMIRNKNCGEFLDKPIFRNVGLMPLHFGVSNDIFENFCNKLIST